MKFNDETCTTEEKGTLVARNFTGNSGGHLEPVAVPAGDRITLGFGIMVALAMLALAWPVGPSFAADPQRTTQPSAAAAGTRVEAMSGDSISSAAYNQGLAEKSSDHYCGTGTCDTAPALLSAQAPVYPADALAAGIEGRAAVLFDIDAQGMPQNVTLQSATAAAFGAAALEAVKSWRFRPATLGGKPVKFQRALQLFPFELSD